MDKKVWEQLQKMKADGWFGKCTDFSIDELFRVRHRVDRGIEWSINDAIERSKSPKKKDMFKAFEGLTPKSIRVIVFGQEPYKDEREHGYAFSVANGHVEDELENIFKAIDRYKGVEYKPENHKTTNLSKWAKEHGVLLLNTSLTYESRETKNMHIKAWRPFIRMIVHNILVANRKKLAVVLLGDDIRGKFYDDIKIEKRTRLSRKLLVLVSNNPTNQGINTGGNFMLLAPGLFEACDKFIEDDIWKEL